MDGIHHITQSTIDPQNSICYIFMVRLPGTYWYRTHTGVQRSDGLFGGTDCYRVKSIGSTNLVLCPQLSTSLANWSGERSRIFRALTLIVRSVINYGHYDFVNYQEFINNQGEALISFSSGKNSLNSLTCSDILLWCL